MSMIVPEVSDGHELLARSPPRQRTARKFCPRARLLHETQQAKEESPLSLRTVTFVDHPVRFRPVFSVLKSISEKPPPGMLTINKPKRSPIEIRDAFFMLGFDDLAECVAWL